MDATDVIFHEKQEGSLCAQHCLNALLQGEYFTAVDLASIAQKLDDEEQERMAEGGRHSESYKLFLEQPSSNMDDSGYFSVQVILSALKVWNLELVPYQSQNEVALTARACPVTQIAFICNYKDHWFAIRKIGRQWFNLNSLLTSPELISDTYLTMFLAQLEQEGYSIFIVIGELPECEADNLLKHVTAVQNVRPKLLSEVLKEKKIAEKKSNERVIDEDKEFQEALRLSLIEAETEESLKNTELSNLDASHSINKPNTSNPTEKLPKKVEVVVDESVLNGTKSIQILEETNMTEEEMLEAALRMSMEES